MIVKTKNLSFRQFSYCFSFIMEHWRA